LRCLSTSYLPSLGFLDGERGWELYTNDVPISSIEGIQVRKCNAFIERVGYNTRWAVQILPQIFHAKSFPNAKLITIFFGNHFLFTFPILTGANDASMADKNPQQHVPLSEYEENLSKIISTLSQLPTHGTKSGHPHIILITPPPLEESAWTKFMNGEVNRLNSITGAITKIMH
jgi:hypothetical protein